MPWKTVDLMDQKLKFVHLAMSGRFTITELCEDFGISRKTGHKYLRRYQQQGACGLKELSRRPRHNAQLTDKAVEKLILQGGQKGWYTLFRFLSVHFNRWLTVNTK